MVQGENILSEKDALKKKRELLINLLMKLRGVWNLAEGVLDLILHVPVEESIIDGLLKIIDNSIDEAKSNIEKMKLQQTRDVLNKIKQEEKIDEIANHQSVNDLLNKI